MAINFPTSLDTLTNPTATDQLNSPSHADQHSDENDAIEALEAKVGADSSAVTSSHDYKIAQLETSMTAHASNHTDGTDDIVMVEHKKNHIEVLALDKGESIFKPISAMRFKVFEEKTYRESSRRKTIEPREIQIEDVTGDGAEDLIAIVHDRILIYPQDI